MEAVHEPLHTLQIPQVHLQMGDHLIGDRQSRLGTVSLVGVTTGHHHVPAPISQGFGGEQAKAGGSAGDQHGARGARSPSRWTGVGLGSSAGGRNHDLLDWGQIGAPT